MYKFQLKERSIQLKFKILQAPWGQIEILLIVMKLKRASSRDVNTNCWLIGDVYVGA